MAEAAPLFSVWTPEGAAWEMDKSQPLLSGASGTERKQSARWSGVPLSGAPPGLFRLLVGACSLYNSASSRKGGRESYAH